jgi:hypothetical protein
VGTNYSGTYRATLMVDANADQRRASRLGDWASGSYKLECGLGEYVAAVSENASQCQGNNRFHGIICAAYSGTVNTACEVHTFDNGDSRNGAFINSTSLPPGDWSSGDWDFSNYKGECGVNHYVAGVSVNPSSGQPHSLLCCPR